MKIEGYVAKSSYKDVDVFLSGNKWVDHIEKLKLGDIKAFPHELNMKDWPIMTGQEYKWAKIIITIDWPL